MKRRAIWSVLLVVVLALGCGEDDPVFDNPFDPANAGDLPVPTAIDVFVGSNVVRLTWSLPEGESADEFAIFRARLDAAGAGEQLIARVQAPTYDDTAVRNGVLYAYRIAAGRSGRFGTRSEVIEVRPNVVSLIIADDAPKTRTRSVTLTPTAPNAVTVKLSETPDPDSAQPRSITDPLTWTLSAGDGPKQLYAMFQLDDGSESIPVSDTITLDTQAVIRSVGFDGAVVRKPGDVAHFALDAGEPAGSAVIEIPGLFESPVVLYDDGTNGDTNADDGTYELDVVLPDRLVSNAIVTGRFVDDVGNEAAALDAPQRLSVQRSPAPVQILSVQVAEPPDAAALTLRWSRFTETDFGSYQIYRSESAPVDSSSLLLLTEFRIGAGSFIDADVVEGRTYHYRVYVEGTGGLMTGSEPMSMLVPNVRPPAAVTIEPISAVGPNSVVVRWSQSPDRDFAAYRLYRNDVGAVGENDVLVIELNDPNETSWNDGGLAENTRYFYRVFTVDEAGLTKGSVEVDATTSESSVPEPVTLLRPTLAEPPNPAAVTLRWTASTASEFAGYRVQRATAPDDTDFEVLAFVPGQTTVEHTDPTVVEGETYSYRVTVLIDSGEQSDSNTQEVTVPNVRAPAPVNLEEPDAVSADRIALRWTRNSNSDFSGYVLFNNTTGAVSDADVALSATSDRDETFFDHTNLVENTTYYYRVYTFDAGGLKSRSNEVSATTKNEPPAAVTLSGNTLGQTSVSLTWQQSTAHDFESYRLYRDTSPAVTTNSTLVIELNERGVTTYRDSGLDPTTEYSYRVFVVDDGVDPGPESTGSNTITLTTE